MAGYPTLEQLQQEVVEAAKLCSCEASLRQALQQLQAPAMLGAEGLGGIEVGYVLILYHMIVLCYYVIFLYYLMLSYD